MSARIPPGFAEIWLQFNTPGDAEPMFISLGVELAGGVSATQTAANNMMQAMIPALDNMVSSAYTLGPGYVLFGNDGGDIRVDATVSVVNGAGAALAYPPNVAVLVRKLSATGGRRNRGRWFIPGAPEAAAGSDGGLDSTYRTTAQSAVDAALTGLVSTSEVVQAVILHDTVPFTPTIITGLAVQTKLATQRRRLRP